MVQGKTIEQIPLETGGVVPEVGGHPRRAEIGVRKPLEHPGILGPGSYELNLERLARSDEVVVGLEKEGRYAVDILSMAKKKK